MPDLRGITWDHIRGWGGLRAAADAFRETHPEVHVTWEARSLQAFADQPVDELDRYDLIVLDHPSIGAAVERGSLVPLDAQIDPTFLRDQRGATVGGSFESYALEGRQWALAVDAAAQVAAYRPDLLDDASLDVPRTWSDVLSAAHALHAVGRSIVMPAIPVDAICGFLGTCAALGREPFSMDGQVVDREVGREALGVLRSVIEVAHPDSLRWDPPRALEHMGRHDDVAYCPLAFGYVTYAHTRTEPHALRFAPAPTAGGHVPSGTLGGAGIAVASASAHVADACAFAAYSASADVQRGVYTAGGGQPGHRAAWTDPVIDAAANGFFSGTLAALDAAYVRPRHAGFLAFQDRAGELVHRYLRDGGDADAVLDRIDDAYRTVGVTR